MHVCVKSNQIGGVCVRKSRASNISKHKHLPPQSQEAVYDNDIDASSTNSSTIPSLPFSEPCPEHERLFTALREAHAVRILCGGTR